MDPRGRRRTRSGPVLLGGVEQMGIHDPDRTGELPELSDGQPRQIQRRQLHRIRRNTARPARPARTLRPGAGIRHGSEITEEQRAQILAAADEGTPIYIYAATNPENDICSLDSLTKAGISAYIGNGNKRNYRNMARYVRQHIDAKRLFVTPAEEAVESASDVLYHLDEDLSFKPSRTMRNTSGNREFIGRKPPKSQS